MKFRALVQEDRKRSRLGALFRKSVLGSMEEWVKEVVSGLEGGHPVLRVACCTGLLLGVGDIKRPSKELGDGLELGYSRGIVEDEAILSLAEVMDSYTLAATHTGSSVEEWEKEFQPAGEGMFAPL